MERRRWSWIAVLASLCGAQAACGSDEGSGDDGGSATTFEDDGAPSSSTTGPGTSGTGASPGAGGASSGGGQNGAGGGSGGGGPSQCLELCQGMHPTGNASYDELAACVYCGECTEDCRDVGYIRCTRPPTGTSCDNKSDCDACSLCAKQMGCAEQTDKCADDPDCINYANCIAQCS